MTFEPKAGLSIYDSSGTPFVLGKELGSGGEGSVWSIENNQQIVVKFYHKGLATEKVRKLQVMCHLQSEALFQVAAWPTAMVTTRGSREQLGLVMRRINGYQAAHLLYSPKSRRTAFPEAQFPFIVHAATNVARAFAAVHDAKQVIGDVNHGNLLIAGNATVALIDCDSFQISDGPDLFPCPVGVPTYTPPELQGCNFLTVRRTEQHDAFGLAVLLFHLLFLGRHPFAGIYKHGTADITIEQAISEYRFAFLPDYNVTGMEPPPSAPRLSDFSPELAVLFVRAFAKMSAGGRRPSAREWITNLEAFGKGIKQCAINTSHHYYLRLGACPWCRVEGMIGMPMFGIKITVGQYANFNINAIWIKIEAVQAPTTQSTIPVSAIFRSNCAPDAKIAEVVRQRRIRRLLGIAAISIAVIIVGVVKLSAVPGILILLAGLVASTKLWITGNEPAKPFLFEFELAEKEYQNTVQKWAEIRNVPAQFISMRQQLKTAKEELVGLPAVRASKLAELNRTRRQAQLRHFLESHRIEDHIIQGIGAGRKSLLASYNIEDAYDIEIERLQRIKGFGPALCGTLLAWRSSIEQQFRFDPNLTVAPADISAVDQEIERRKATLIQTLSAGPQQLQGILLPWQANRSLILTTVEHSAKRLAQAEVNREALRKL